MEIIETEKGKTVGYLGDQNAEDVRKDEQVKTILVNVDQSNI